MNEDTCKSEVARLMRQIDREYGAAERALYGFATGTTRHNFINARMENVSVCFREVREMVGDQTAGALLLQAEQARVSMEKRL
jgi:hypothetical protein